MSQVQSNSPTQQNAVSALTGLLRRDLDTAEFYDEFLRLLPTPEGTTHALAWEISNDSVQRVAGWALATTTPDAPLSKDDQARLMGAVIQSGEPELYDLADISTDPQVAMVGIFPVHTAQGVIAVIQAFFSAEVPFPTAKSFLAQANLWCGFAASHHLPSESDDATPSFIQVASQLHKSLDVEETAYAIANEGRRVTGCDRLSVLIRYGNKYKVKAVSGQESAHPRANAVKSLQRLVARTVAINEPFWYPEKSQSVPPEIEEPLEEHLDLSMCRSIGVLPLFPASVSDDPTKEQLPVDDKREPIAALVIEHFSDVKEGRGALLQQADVIAEQSGLALGNARQHEDVFLLPLWRWVGGFRKYFRGNRRNKTLGILSLLGFALFLLCVIPYPFRISSEGKLQPTVRRKVFAQLDGTVENVLVTENQLVEADQPLLELRSDGLDMEQRKLQGERLTLQAGIDAMMARRLADQRGQQPADPAELQAAAAQESDLRQQLAAVNRQIELHASMREKLTVRSPIAGRVITWNLQDVLADRPVGRGQLLLEVVDPTSAWNLELELPDRRIAQVLRAKGASEEPLPVTYILASNPGTRLGGSFRSIEKRTNSSPDAGQYVRVLVDIEKAEGIEFQPGTKVQAKIDCGKRPMIKVWMNDIWQFVQSRILFRIW